MLYSKVLQYSIKSNIWIYAILLNLQTNMQCMQCMSLVLACCWPPVSAVWRATQHMICSSLSDVPFNSPCLPTLDSHLQLVRLLKFATFVGRRLDDLRWRDDATAKSSTGCWRTGLRFKFCAKITRYLLALSMIGFEHFILTCLLPWWSKCCRLFWPPIDFVIGHHLFAFLTWISGDTWAGRRRRVGYGDWKVRFWDKLQLQS